MYCSDPHACTLVYLCLLVLRMSPRIVPAIRTAEVLLGVSAAFAVTNEPATGKVTIPLPLPRPKKSKGYKALVILNMAGGADTFVSVYPLPIIAPLAPVYKCICPRDKVFSGINQCA